MSHDVSIRFESAGTESGPAAPVRLDRYLASRFGQHSRADFARLIAEGVVTVDGRRARKGETLLGGEEIRLPLPEPRAAWLVAPDFDRPLDLRYEDSWLLCVEKPPGIPCIPLRPDEHGTVANALVARFPELNGIGGPLEAGLLHRLDAGTSGLLAVARSWDAYERLREAWRSGRVTKVYLAVVRGAVRAAGRIDAPLAHHPRSARRMILARDPAAPDALEAHTDYEPIQVVERDGARGGTEREVRTLVRVRLGEGRRHQIRVHLASVGHPVLGDALYGGGAGPRLALHSHRLALPHPETGALLELESPLPAELLSLFEAR